MKKLSEILWLVLANVLLLVVGFNVTVAGIRIYFIGDWQIHGLVFWAIVNLVFANLILRMVIEAKRKT